MALADQANRDAYNAQSGYREAYDPNKSYLPAENTVVNNTNTGGILNNNNTVNPNSVSGNITDYQTMSGGGNYNNYSNNNNFTNMNNNSEATAIANMNSNATAIANMNNNSNATAIANMNATANYNNNTTSNADTRTEDEKYWNNLYRSKTDGTGIQPWLKKQADDLKASGGTLTWKQMNDWYDAGDPSKKVEPKIVDPNYTNIDINSITPWEPDVSSSYTGDYEKAPETIDYIAPEQYNPSESDLVQGRMQGLLSSGSPYMENARATGERQAQARGMMNSNLSGQYGQKAAIESALPIAQQDSNSLINANMAGYEGKLQGALLSQGYQGDLGKISAQEGASSRLAQQDFNQSGKLKEYQGLIDSGLSAQQAAQQLNLSYNEAQWASQLSTQGFDQDQLAMQYKGLIDSGLSAQEANQQLNLTNAQGKNAYDQAVMIQEATTNRANVQNSFDNAISVMNLASDDMASITSQMTSLNQTYSNAVAQVQVRDDLSSDAKSVIVNDAFTNYKNAVSSLTNMYDIELTW